MEYFDMEDALAKELRDILKKEFPSASFGVGYIRTSAVFPFVQFRKAGSTDSVRYASSNTDDCPVRQMYEVNIYSNKADYASRRVECKSILRVVNQWAHSRNLMQSQENELPNEYDSSITRFAATYSVIVQGNKLYTN